MKTSLNSLIGPETPYSNQFCSFEITEPEFPKEKRFKEITELVVLVIILTSLTKKFGTNITRISENYSA